MGTPVVVSNAITTTSTGTYEVISYTVPSNCRLRIKAIVIGGEPTTWSTTEANLGYVYLQINGVNYRGIEARAMQGDIVGIYGQAGRGGQNLLTTFGAGFALPIFIFDELVLDENSVVKVIAEPSTTTSTRWRGTIIGEIEELPPPPPPLPIYKVDNQFPMVFVQTFRATELISKVPTENVEIIHVAKNFPEYLVEYGKSKTFLSKARGLPPEAWYMFHHDRKRTGRTTRKNVIYVAADDGYLYALNPDGSLKWRFTEAQDIARPSPSVYADGTIYIGSWVSAAYLYACLYAVNPDGSLKWKYPVSDMIESTAAITHNSIYFGSDNHYFYALYNNGYLKWRYLTGDWVRSSPAIDRDGYIYVGSDDYYLYVFRPDGSIKWRYLTGDWVRSSPAIADDGTVYVGSHDGYLYALNPDGSLKWRYQAGSISAPAIADDGTIYAGSTNDYIWAINSDGSLKWRYLTGNDVVSSPAIADDGTIYVGSMDYYLYALYPNGSLKWRYQTGHYIESSPAIDGNGTIYVGSDDHYLHAVNLDGSFKWKYLAGASVVSSPSVF